MFVVTENALRTHLKKRFHLPQFPSHLHFFHMFRCSGATLDCNMNIDKEKIMRHGTWHSNAVDSYIIPDPTVAAGVAKSFARLL